LVSFGRVNSAQRSQGIVKLVLLFQLVDDKFGFEGHPGQHHQHQQ
jgi:hypothetical protein